MRIAVLTAAVLASATVLSPASAGTGYFFRAKPIVAAATSAAPLAATVSTPVTVVSSGTAKPFSATGGAEPYAWSATGLPTGVTLAADGTLTVAANAAAGTTAGLMATVADAAGKTATATFSLTVTAPTGSLMAFGYNPYGQVLPNSQNSQAAPVSIGSATSWSVADGGTYETCAIRAGDLYCWGNNDSGQLGTNGTTSVTDGPRLVTAGGWTDVTVGESHACGIRNGRAHCWGYNSNGRLGDGTATNRTSGPVAVGGGTGTEGWTDITAGESHSCGIRNGTAYCWGYDSSGQVGVGSTSTSRGFSAVGGGTGTTGWTEIAAGSGHTCGIRNDELLCWGKNGSGQLGSGGTVDRLNPTPVSGTAGWSGLVSTKDHACALRGGVAYCWGYNNAGQVGVNGTANATSGPLAVGGGSGSMGWSMLAAGDSHACGIRSSALLCWGSNGHGQLGVPGASDGPTLRTVAGTGWKYVAAGAAHTLALR